MPLHRPPGRAALAFILVTAFLDIVALGIVIPVMPPLLERFAGSAAHAGELNGLFVALWGLMQFLAAPVIGSLSDRYGRRPVLLISAAGVAGDYVIMALAPSLWWLAVGRMLSGVTTASFTTAFAYMADITPPEGRARAYGLVGAAFSAGFVAGPVMGGFLGEFGPQVPFWAAAALSSCTFLYGLFVLPESLPPERRMQFSWGRANPFGALALLRSHAELSGLALVNFLLFFAHHLYAAVFVLYTGFRFGWGPWQVGAALALWGALDIIVQGVLVARLVKRFGDHALMTAGLAFGGAGMAAMGFATTPAQFIGALVITTLWGLSIPTIQALMTVRVSESEQGQLQGANASVASVAGIVSPLFFGWVYARSIDANPLFPLAGAAFLIAALVLVSAALLGWRVGQKAAAAQ